ncbi:MARVEL domain-containing protein 3 [Nothoprocta perdicaria]|uniref:MARVEL domain-containing protein 3 n=1 Tax=Nothoprocta perdicaria TaxID=30464 RepID=UPI000E1BDBDD|nr:MARVEL domain-containing protein 3 [Nothoprocta perdicaria]
MAARGGGSGARAAPAAWPGSATAAQGLLEGRRCRYLCTGRACCQALEALLALLILVCGCVSLGPPGGYTGLADLGGLYYYQFGGAYSGLTGADGERARRLDQQLGALKAPLARAVVAGGAALAAAAALKLLAGALRLPWRLPAWLLLEGGLDVAVAAALPPAMYCCFRELLGVYGSPVCTEREQLYGSKGYQGFRCGLHGAEVAAGVAGSLAVVAHLVSATLALRAYCAVRRLKRKPAAACGAEPGGGARCSRPPCAVSLTGKDRADRSVPPQYLFLAAKLTSRNRATQEVDEL